MGEGGWRLPFAQNEERRGIVGAASGSHDSRQYAPVAPSRRGRPHRSPVHKYPTADASPPVEEKRKVYAALISRSGACSPRPVSERPCRPQGVLGSIDAPIVFSVLDSDWPVALEQFLERSRCGVVGREHVRDTTEDVALVFAKVVTIPHQQLGERDATLGDIHRDLGLQEGRGCKCEPRFEIVRVVNLDWGTGLGATVEGEVHARVKFVARDRERPARVVVRKRAFVGRRRATQDGVLNVIEGQPPAADIVRDTCLAAVKARASISVDGRADHREAPRTRLSGQRGLRDGPQLRGGREVVAEGGAAREARIVDTRAIGRYELVIQREDLPLHWPLLGEERPGQVEAVADERERLVIEDTSARHHVFHISE
eukprot:scaffold190625_cov28-Tisochrysis_lutea.AAC.2